MEVKDFMLFIGERATGKSTIAKSIYFFESLRDDLIDYYIERFRKEAFDERINEFSRVVKDKFVKYFGLSYFMPSNLELKFQYTSDIENYILISLNSEKQIAISYGKKIVSEHNSVLNKWRNYIDKYGNGDSNRLKDIILRDLQKTIVEDIQNLFDYAGYFMFIPAQRSLLTTLSGQFSSFDKMQDLDYLTKAFRYEIDRIKQWSVTKKHYSHLSKSKAENILGGTYLLKGDIEFINIGRGKEVKLNFASSGQQESLWILNALNFLMIEYKENLVVVEEPESHLDPKTQIAIVDLLVYFAVSMKNKLFITTHSPYILATVNNLMYAYQVARSYPDEVKKIVPESLWLDPSRVGAYECKNGGIVDLIAPDGLIMNEELDRASIDINGVNNELFAIKNEATHEL
jgi:hypothetical protein